MVHHRGAWWLATAAFFAVGCSGDPSRGGEQPYGAGTTASDEPMMPGGGAGSSGMSGTSGVGGEGGVAGMSGMAGSPMRPACEETSAPMPLGACVALPDPSAGEFLSMTGVVEAIEQPSSTSCTQRALGFMADADPSEIYDLVIRGSESTARIAVRLPPQLPWSPAFIAVGETVSVDYKAELPLDSVGHGVLTVRDEAGELRLWVVQAANGFDSVSIPDLVITDEQVTCSAMVPCGTKTHSRIHAVGRVDETSIEYAGIGELSDFVVLLADNTKVTIADSCSATRSFHRVVIAALRRGTLPPLD